MKKKILIAFVVTLCAALLVAGSVFGTLAYLTATKTVTNTFTYGAVAIKMDETKVDVYGAPLTGADAGKTESGNAYKLIPGKTYKKDPVIHVTAGSEKCYLILKVESNLTNVETTDATKTIAAQLAGNWTYDSTKGVYYYNQIVDASASATDLDVPTFTTFTTANSNAGWPAADGLKIVVTAYAVQAEGFDSASDAYTAAFGTPANNG